MGTTSEGSSASTESNGRIGAAGAAAYTRLPSGITIQVSLMSLVEKLFHKILVVIADLAMPWRARRDPDYRDRRNDFTVVCARARRKSERDVAIVALYQDQGLSRFAKRLLESFARQNVAVIAVSNLPLSEADRAYLHAHVWTVVERPNVGQDFGAYRCGYLHLLNSGEVPRRLFFANDSFFCFSDFDRCIETVQQSGAGFCGLTENHSSPYHVSSFFLSVTGEIALSTAFKTFWQTYKPLSVRQHAFRAGEARLTQLLVQEIGLEPHIQFDLQRIGAVLLDLEPADLSDALLSLPPDLLAACAEDAQRLADAALEPQNPGTRHRQRALVRRWLAAGEEGNQAHVFALILVRYLNAPFLKRDLCIRADFRISQVLGALAPVLDGNDIEAVRDDLRRKGYSFVKSRIDRILHRYHRI